MLLNLVTFFNLCGLQVISILFAIQNMNSITGGVQQPTTIFTTVYIGQRRPYCKNQQEQSSPL